MRVILDKYNDQTVTTTHRMITVKKHSHYTGVSRCVRVSWSCISHSREMCHMLIQTSWKKLLLTRIQKAKFKKSGIFYHMLKR